MPTFKQLYNFYINYIKNNPDKKEVIREKCSYLTQECKIIFIIILRNIIILDKIKDRVINTTIYDDKIKLLADIKTNNNYSKLFSIVFKNIYDKKINYLVNKEIFSRKTLEEQNQIRAKINKDARDRYKNLDECKKKTFYIRRRERYIKINGLEQYKSKLRERYRNWYKKLSPSKLQEIKEKRKKRYDSLPSELKKKYKLWYLNKSMEERKKLLNIYRENRKRKFENLSEEEKNNIKIKMRNYKNNYYHHLSEETKEKLNKSRALKRKLNNNQIGLNDYTYLKNQL
jgi:hypothetical protein